MKRFRDYLIESDLEYKYEIKSINNIHSDEMLNMIRLALAPYQLRDVRSAGFKPLDKINELFPSYPNTSIYTVRVVTGLPVIPESAVSSLALFTSNPDDHFMFYEEGTDPLKVEDGDEDVITGDYKPTASTEPEYSASVDADLLSDEEVSAEVGLKRIDAFMKELEDERNERLNGTREEKVYESFVVPHTIAKSFIGNDCQLGFYLVERKGDKKFTLSGPFTKQPDNYRVVFDLRNTIIESKILNEHRGDGNYYNCDVLVEFSTDYSFDTNPIKSIRPYEVSVTDPDTGKSFNVLVKSVDEITARDLAIKKVAKKFNLDVNVLVAEKPE